MTTSTNPSIKIERRKVIFTGIIDTIEKSMIDVLNKKVIIESRLLFDFTSLIDLKAKGVEALAQVIEKSPNYITIKVNNDYSWQTPTISAFNIIKPGGIKII